MKRILSFFTAAAILMLLLSSAASAEGYKSIDEAVKKSQQRTLEGAKKQADENEQKFKSDYENSRKTETVYTEVYVSGNGSDENDGSEQNPFRTIEKAKEYVKSISYAMTGDIIVHVASGKYYLDNPLEFLSEDSGKNGYKIVYSGDKDNMPEISGSVSVGNFKRSEKYPLLLEAYIPGFETDGIHTMMVDGKMRYVCRSETWINPSGNYKAEKSKYTADGFYLDKKYLGKIDNLSALELGYCDAWLESTIHVKDITEDPKNKDRYIVIMENPTWDTLGSIGNRIYPSYAHSFVARNQMCLLDSPGEFYYDRNKSTLYYMPADDESMESIFEVPILDFAMFFVGNASEDKVKNITFENFKISGFKSVNTYNDIIIPGQALSATIRGNETSSDGEMGTVHLDKAHNINFFDNYFTGLGQIGIRLYNDCSECMIVGNSFLDIGNAAVAVGSINNYTMLRESWMEEQEPKVFENPNTDFCLNLKFPAISTSNTTVGETQKANGALHPERGTKKNYTSIPNLEKYKEYKENSNAHKSREEDIGNKKSWVMYDFYRRYNYSEVALCFDPELVSDSEKSDFEILLSNDKHFSEGSYEVAAVQRGAADEVSRYKIKTDKKYRYVMIRTLENTPFALSYGFVFTKDIPNGVREKMCDKITISDNYITRVCQERYADTGIFVFACDNAKIVHNDISYTPYSGISFGWGWSYEWYCGENADIGYNKLYNTMQMLQDGGALYTLSFLENSVIHDNYSFASNAGVSYYHDQGSSGIFNFNNVAELTRRAYNVNATGVGTQKAFGNFKANMYAWEPDSKVRYAGDYTLLNDNIEYIPGNMPPEAEAIALNAGVREEYNKTKSLVRELLCSYSHWSGMTDHFPRAVEVKNIAENNIQKVIDSNNFGFRHGMYYYPLKNELKSIFKVKYSNNSEYMKLLELTESIKTGYLMPTYDEMVSECELLLSEVIPKPAADLKKSDENAAAEEDYNVFKEFVRSSKAKSSAASEAEKCDMRNELAYAYDEFLGKTTEPYFDYIDIDGLKTCEIDKKNRKVILTVSKGCDGKKGLKVFLADNTKLANVLSALNAGGETKAVLYSVVSGRYTEWSIETRYEGENIRKVINADMLSTDLKCSGIIKNVCGGGKYFTSMRGEQAYYTEPCIDASGGASVSFAVENSNINNELTFMLGADTLDGFNPGSSENKYDRIELSFKNKLMKVSRLEGGAEKILYTSEAPVKYNEKNNMEYRLEEAGQNTRLMLTVNGEAFDYIIPGVYNGCAFGFYAYSNGIIIYGEEDAA